MGWYYAFDEKLTAQLDRAYELCRRLNRMERSSDEYKILEELFGRMGEGTVVRAPFYCDCGGNITVENDCFINYESVSWQIVKLANNPAKSRSYSKENYSKGKRYLSKFSSFLMVMRSF